MEKNDGGNLDLSELEAVLEPQSNQSKLVSQNMHELALSEIETET